MGGSRFRAPSVTAPVLHLEGVDKKMKRASFSIVAAALLFMVPSVFGQKTSMYVNGSYQGNNWTYGGKTSATGFYDGSINGVQVGPGQPGGLGMICDDFKDNVYAGEHWTANAINASSLNSSNISQLLFGGVGGIGLAGYTEVAYLVNQMFTTNPNAATQTAYSQAIWALTNSGVSYSALSAAAKTLYNTAISMCTHGQISLSQFKNLWIYTPTVRGSGEAQEMWGLVPVPEGGTALAYLLLAAISCFGAMRLRVRRQASAGKSVV